MKIFKLALIIISTLKIIDYIEGAGMIIYTIDTNNEGCRDNFIQIKWNGKQ